MPSSTMPDRDPAPWLSMLRAPYGWTNRMRREEGYPDRGDASGARPIGWKGNLLMALGLYGPFVIGAYVGWRSGGWVGLAIGAVLGPAVALLVLLVVAPFLGARRSSERDR